MSPTTICAWCPEFDATAITNRNANHGICPRCAAKMLGESAAPVSAVERTIEERQRTPDPRRSQTLTAALLIVLFLILPTAASAQELVTPLTPLAAAAHRPWQTAAPYVALVAANVADLWTTQAAFTRGAHEANPVMAPLTFPRMILAKSATTAGLMLVMHALATHGHPRFAKVIGYLDAGAIGAVAISNARVR